jgi:two-component system phosphate regulon sensor histidine kinase PhoR
VLDAEVEDHEVRAFVSRRPGPEDDEFRRLLVNRLIPDMQLDEEVEQLRHLHQELDGRNYLISYWQRSGGGHRYLIVVWHYVEKLVLEVMPQLYGDVDRTSRVNVVDQEGRILFGEPLQGSAPTVGLQFPTTLYGWRLNVALTSAETLAEQAIRQRYVQLGVVGLAMLIAIVGIVIIVRATVEERRLAALRSEFVANVSHELKTPLASVRMFGEMLLTGRVPNEDKRREYLQIIVGESERLTSLIDNVLDFAKVEGGRAAYELEHADLADVAVRAVELLHYRAEREGVALEARTEPAPVTLDTRAVELALVNLIDNALKYAKGSGRVEVEVLPTKEGGASLRVIDQGPGIDPEEHERIFDRFVRGRGAQALHVRGSGIGLALVKHIADSHGATVTVESPLSEAGTGTAFQIVFPATPPPRAPNA